MNYARRSFLGSALGAALFPWVPAAARAAAAMPLELAVFPYLSTTNLIKLYRPLTDYLSQRLARPVLVITAPDQETFVRRTEAGEYRFVITAPHFARLAQKEAGYVPFLRANHDLYGELMVAKEGPIHRVEDLRGKTVTLPDQIAIVAMLGEKLLRDHGLEPGKTVFLRYAVSHNSAVLAVERDESAGAFTARTAFQQMPRGIQEGVRRVATTDSVPHVMYLANPQVAPEEVNVFSGMVLDFIANTPEGRQFNTALGWGGMRPPTEQELRSLDPYVGMLQKLLRKAQ